MSYVYGEASSNVRDAPNVCLSFVLLFTIFNIVVTQKLVLQQSKNVTAKYTETLSPPSSIQYLLGFLKIHEKNRHPRYILLLLIMGYKYTQFKKKEKTRQFIFHVRKLNNNVDKV